MNLNRYAEGLMVVMLLVIIVLVSLLGSYERRIRDLEVRVRANKELAQETMRIVIPNEIALKEKIDG